MNGIYGTIDGAVGDRGVLTTQHPDVCMPVQLKTATQVLKAGTVLKASATAGTYEPAAEADTPACVLVEDSDGTTGLQNAVFHGVVVKSRLLNASGESAVAATDILTAKLPAIGIYVTQIAEGDVK